MPHSIIASAAVILSLTAPGIPATASSPDGPAARVVPVAGSGYGSYGSKRKASRTPTPAATEAIVDAMQAATRYCEWVKPREYVIDCLSERLDDVKRDIAGNSGYEDVRDVLGDTSRQLRDIARQNRSRTLPRTRFRQEGPNATQTNRALVAVDSARLDRAAAQALSVIRQAETRLLRSSGGSADATQFQRIAGAMGSNKVLLRSI